MLKVTYENKIHILVLLIVVVVLLKMSIFFVSSNGVSQEIPADVSVAPEAQLPEEKQPAPTENAARIVNCTNFKLKKGESVKAGDLTLAYGGTFLRGGSNLQNHIAKFVIKNGGKEETKFLESRELTTLGNIDFSVEIVSVLVPQGGLDEVKMHIAGADECVIA